MNLRTRAHRKKAHAAKGGEMKIKVGSICVLKDKNSHNYGQVLVTELQGDWIIGKLDKGQDFWFVRDLFTQLEEVANSQMLSLLDEIVVKLEELEFCICDFSYEQCVAIMNVQVMNENDICFKLRL